MALFDENTTKQLTEILSMMKEDVELLYFTQEIECPTCKDGHSFVSEIAALNSKIRLKAYTLVKDHEVAEQYQIDKIPAIAVLDKDGKDTRVRFFGIPAGYEINSFLGSILETSSQITKIPPEIQERIDKIDHDVHIQVFVSLGCPHCPDAVSAAHLLAMQNSHVRADMVETSTFPHLAVKYNVSGVPKAVFNDKIEFVGAQPVMTFLDVIEELGKQAT